VARRPTSCRGCSMPLMDLLAREARFGRARSLADGSLPLGPAQRRGLQRQRLRLQAHRLVRGDGTLARLWPPTPPLVFSFFFGAVLGFAVVGVAACGGVTVEFGAESNRVQLWGSFRFISLGWRWGPRCFRPRTRGACRDGPWGRSWPRPPTSWSWVPRAPPPAGER
jgi:hypothetical protein